MKFKAKWVLTRLSNGAERRFNKVETAVEFARRECARMGYGDIVLLDPVTEYKEPVEIETGWKMPDNYHEIFVELPGGELRAIYSYDCEIEFDE